MFYNYLLLNLNTPTQNFVGYDRDGYNRYGFDENGYDNRGFDIYGVSILGGPDSSDFYDRDTGFSDLCFSREGTFWLC